MEGKEMLGSLIRGVLWGLSGLLASKGIFPDGFAEEWVNTTAGVLAAILLSVGALVWSHLTKQFNRESLEAAVQLPPPPADTKAEIKAAVTEAKAVASASDTVTVPY
jgi:hypothetical protein